MTLLNIKDAIIGKYPIIFGDSGNLFILIVFLLIAFFLFSLVKKHVEKLFDHISDENKDVLNNFTKRYTIPVVLLFFLVIFWFTQKWFTGCVIAAGGIYWLIIRNRIPSIFAYLKTLLVSFVLLLMIAFIADLAVYDYQLSKNDDKFKVFFVLCPSAKPKFITRFEAFTNTWKAVKQSEKNSGQKIKIFPEPRPDSILEFSNKYSLNMEKNIVLYGIEKQNPIDIILMCQWLSSDDNKDYFRIKPFRIKSKPRLLEASSNWEAPEGMPDFIGSLEEVLEYAKWIILNENTKGTASSEPEASVADSAAENIEKGYQKKKNTLLARYETLDP